jgi:hypothetical protein
MMTFCRVPANASLRPMSQVDVTLHLHSGAVALWAVQDSACQIDLSGVLSMLTCCIRGIAGEESQGLRPRHDGRTSMELARRREERETHGALSTVH